MKEGFRIEGAVARFQDIEMVGDEPAVTDWEVAVHEIRKSGIVPPEFEKGYGDVEISIIPKNGRWPDTGMLPETVRSVFDKALAAERLNNSEVDAWGCMVSIRIQGDEKASDVGDYKKNIAQMGDDPERPAPHYDGGSYGDLSEYVVSSGPTTLQFLGETTLPKTTYSSEQSLRKALNEAPTSSLYPVSLLKGYMYHMTNRTPHAEPANLDQHISNQQPRLFIRLIFAPISKTMKFADHVIGDLGERL